MYLKYTIRGQHSQWPTAVLTRVYKATVAGAYVSETVSIRPGRPDDLHQSSGSILLYGDRVLAADPVLWRARTFRSGRGESELV